MTAGPPPEVHPILRGRWSPAPSIRPTLYSEFATYDLGQAVAHMAIQAQARGLATRQFRAFDRDALAEEFDVPGHWEVTTMMAIGAVPPEIRPHAATLSNGDPVPRDRREVQDLLWTDDFLLSSRRPGRQTQTGGHAGRRGLWAEEDADVGAAVERPGARTPGDRPGDRGLRREHL